MTPQDKAYEIADLWTKKCQAKIALDAASRMYEWTKQQMIDRALEWLEANLQDYAGEDDKKKHHTC